MGKAPKNSKSRKAVEEEEDVDYAAVADSYAGKYGSDEDSDDDDNFHDAAADELQGDHEDSEDGQEDGDDNAESGSEEEESESEGSGDDDSSGSSDGENDDDQPDRSDDAQQTLPASEASKSTRPPSTSHAEPCTFDLRNLLAMNTHQVDSVALYKPARKVKKSVDDDSAKSATATTTIPGESLPAVANEDVLLRMATDGCSQLIAALWQLPVERSDAGPLVTLPSYDELRIPRALPPPPPKQETKWEKFAKERGIALNKNKRSQKVWDEATQSWMYRHGYNKANDSSKEWPIMEIKDGQDPFQDPWQAQREAKKAKLDKNALNQLKNQERAGAIPKGTANKVIKSRTKVREAGMAGGNLDRDRLPSGVPVDLPRTKGGDGDVAARPSHRGKQSTVDALTAVQRSTASLGKFDKMREGEPERKKSLASLKKRKYESATDKKVLSTEAERGMKVLKAVVEGGGAAKERAIKKGKLAKGETAYDYDYSDGLGASSFRKKKGRAGAGKMKKMTKKRVK